MSKQLEDFIRNNSEQFDDLEPRMELWGRIATELQQQDKISEQAGKREAKTFSLGFVMRVAAVVIMVMGLGFILYVKNEKSGKIDYAAINPEYAKQRVEYASLVQAKRTEVKNLTIRNPDLYKEFSADIANMDSTYKKLNHDLATSPNQERVLRAMIRNLQIQTEVLNQQLNVIEQFNEFKKQQKNETKSI
jgi:hypothetical protein